MDIEQKNYLPKICSNCGTIYIGNGKQSNDDRSKEICADCYTVEIQLEKRLVPATGFVRQIKRFHCPKCDVYLISPSIFNYIIGLIKVFYVAEKREIKPIRTIGFRCVNCSTLSYSMSSLFVNNKEKRIIQMVIQSQLENCPDCKSKMQYLNTEEIQYSRTNGAIFVKDVMCKMRFKCLYCQKEYVKQM